MQPYSYLHSSILRTTGRNILRTNKLEKYPLTRSSAQKGISLIALSIEKKKEANLCSFLCQAPNY